MKEFPNSKRSSAKAWSSAFSLEIPSMEPIRGPEDPHSLVSIIKLSELYLRHLVIQEDFEEIRLRQKCPVQFELDPKGT